MFLLSEPRIMTFIVIQNLLIVKDDHVVIMFLTCCLLATCFDSKMLPTILKIVQRKKTSGGAILTFLEYLTRQCGLPTFVTKTWTKKKRQNK